MTYAKGYAFFVTNASFIPLCFTSSQKPRKPKKST